MMYSGINRVVILLLVMFFGLEVLTAQQFPDYSLYYINAYTINPAIAGANRATNLNFIAREESVGFEGTPKTHAFSVDSRILENNNLLRKLSLRKGKVRKPVSGNVGLGFYLYNDQNGPIDKTSVNGTYSYHIDFEDSQLSFGLSIVLFQLKIQKGDFITSDGELNNDDLLIGGDESIWITDANFGVFYSSAKYYCGYSAIQLFNSYAQFGANGQGEFKLTRQHVLIGGYKFQMSNMLELEPLTLIKMKENIRAQCNLGFRFIYDRRFWAGLNYRTGNIISFHGGLKIDKYYVGYAFDYGINSMSQHTFGTHELIVSIRFGDDKLRYKWLDRF